MLYLRKIGTHDLLAQLFGVTGSTLTRAIQEVRHLLATSGPTIPPSTARFRTPADVTAHLDRYGNQQPRKIKPAC
ncbi:transposase family protein [Streptomyces sioyaensis]|uniref:transposase family protein n=1 Tax=Streptomyces sioyaensis TaxID=67364 RepID=UPI0037CDD336